MGNKIIEQFLTIASQTNNWSTQPKQIRTLQSLNELTCWRRVFFTALIGVQIMKQPIEKTHSLTRPPLIPSKNVLLHLYSLCKLLGMKNELWLTVSTDTEEQQQVSKQLCCMFKFTKRCAGSCGYIIYRFYKWTSLSKIIITQFCQAHRHRHVSQTAHWRPPCKQGDTALSQPGINSLIYNTDKTCFPRLLFTQIFCRAQLEVITRAAEIKGEGISHPKMYFLTQISE